MATHVIWTNNDGQESGSDTSSDTTGAGGTNSAGGSSLGLRPVQGSLDDAKFSAYHILFTRSRGKDITKEALYLDAQAAGHVVTQIEDSSSSCGSERRADLDVLHESSAWAPPKYKNLEEEEGSTADTLLQQFLAAEEAAGEEPQEYPNDDDGDAVPAAFPENTDPLLRQVLRQCGAEEHQRLVEIMMHSDRPAFSQMSQFWSLGTAEHCRDACRPCTFVRTAVGCNAGSQCKFCHCPHPNTIPRACKAKRQYFRQFQAALLEAYDDAPGVFMATTREASSNNQRVQSLINSWFRRRMSL